MMVETILESSQDFGMSNVALPQWKREVLQRRAARRGAAACAPQPPPPPAEDEELRYGPGIVKRLKSRYLSLALRDAPRRRPSVLRRAASLEHLLDERPPPAPRPQPPARPRPLSLAAPPPAPPAHPRRDSVKRARSVDALSRLDSREELPPPSPSPPPARGPPRAARPPRRPAPLLRDAERPPPDVVRSTLRKFESAPPRRQPPAARVSAVLRGLETRRSVTPEPRSPSPQARSPPPLPTTPPPTQSPVPPALDTPAPLSPPPSPVAPCPPARSSPEPPPLSPSVLPCGSLVPTEPAPLAPPSPPVAAASHAVSPPSFPAAAPLGTVRPQSPPAMAAKPAVAPRPAPTPPAAPALPGDELDEAGERRVSRAALEGIARAGCTMRYMFESPRAASHLPPLSATNPVLAARAGRRVGVIRPLPPRGDSPPPPALAPEKASPARGAAQVNGHSTPEPLAEARLGAGGVRRAWTGAALARVEAGGARDAARPAWLRAGGRARPDAPAATSVVFNFSDRKEVPDYIENDGIVLRGPRRSKFKAGESGIVVLAGAAGAAGESDEEEAAGAEEPCRVRFVNDNVLINGRSSMPARRDRDRQAKLKLQFDDSLTRTFEYPSETSLCEDSPPAPPPAPALADNTHIASAALSRYTPCKSSGGAPPPLGLQPQPAPEPAAAGAGDGAADARPSGGDGAADARPCAADAAKSWSEARALATDLLF